MNLHDRLMSEGEVQPDKAWIGQTVSAARKSAKAQWGSGWARLTPEMQNAYIARAILSTIAGQAKSTWKDNETAASLVHLAKAAMGAH